MRNIFKDLDLTKIFTVKPKSAVAVEISENGVLRVDAARLLKSEPAKRQLKAAQRLQRSHFPLPKKYP